MDELKAIIRSLAISSPSGMTLSELEHDFKSHEGSSIPFQKHGFKSLLSMLQTLTDVVRVNGSDQSGTIHPVTTDKNQHIRALVEKSKKSKKSKKVKFYSRPTSSQKTHEPKGKPSASGQQRSNGSTKTGKRSTGWKGAHKTPSQRNYAGYHYGNYSQVVQSMQAASGQKGQYDWMEYINSLAAEYLNAQSWNGAYSNNQQYYQNNMQQSNGWNYNQASSQQRVMNNYPGNSGYWDGCYPQNCGGKKSMYYQVSSGHNNAGGYQNPSNYSMGNRNINYNNSSLCNNAGGYQNPSNYNMGNRNMNYNNSASCYNTGGYYQNQSNYNMGNSNMNYYNSNAGSYQNEYNFGTSNNNMQYNNSTGCNCCGGNPNQHNYGMYYGYENNCPWNGYYHYGSNNYDVSNWDNAYGQYQYYS